MKKILLLASSLFIISACSNAEPTQTKNGHSNASDDGSAIVDYEDPYFCEDTTVFAKIELQSIIEGEYYYLDLHSQKHEVLLLEGIILHDYFEHNQNTSKVIIPIQCEYRSTENGVDKYLNLKDEVMTLLDEVEDPYIFLRETILFDGNQEEWTMGQRYVTANDDGFIPSYNCVFSVHPFEMNSYQYFIYMQENKLNESAIYNFIIRNRIFDRWTASFMEDDPWITYYFKEGLSRSEVEQNIEKIKTNHCQKVD